MGIKKQPFLLQILVSDWSYDYRAMFPPTPVPAGLLDLVAER